jgi:photosystem II stability/assembly factor-like uncharacterized protein
MTTLRSSIAAQLRKYRRIVVTGATLVLFATALLRNSSAYAQSASLQYLNDFFSVAITPAAQWIVGSKGLLLNSTDGGHTWDRRTFRERTGGPTLQDLDLLSIRFTADGQTGWIGGENGLIAYTPDGGRTWQPRNAPFSDQNIFRVAPLDSQKACAVGTDGTLLCTSDAGAHWNSHRFDQYIDLNDVTFVGNEGWAVGAYRTILHTSDGGGTWQLQNGGNTKVLGEESYFAVVFADAQHGWVTGLAGEIVSTSDGGRTWQQYNGGGSRPSLFAAAGAWPSLWFGGKSGSLLERAGDDHWRDARISFDDITDIAFAGNLGLVVGLGGTILQTTDGGKTWHSVAIN